jgi:hypothetical protein
MSFRTSEKQDKRGILPVFALPSPYLRPIKSALKVYASQQYYLVHQGEMDREVLVNYPTLFREI